MNPQDTPLTDTERALLLRIARESLETYANAGARLDLAGYPLTAELKNARGAFVTLWRGGDLRGCIGYTRAVGSLAEAVRDNAINAGFRDPRFSPVLAPEIPLLKIEVSAMCPGDEPGSPFRLVRDLQTLELGLDGLYLEPVNHRGGGLLLPQVPLEYHWDLDQFLDALCRKAGAPRGAWKDPRYRLYRFRAEVFAEES